MRSQFTILAKHYLSPIDDNLMFSCLYHRRSPRIYRVMTYLSLHLIANKTLEFVYENAPECNIYFEMKTSGQVSTFLVARGSAKPLPDMSRSCKSAQANSAFHPSGVRK